MKIFKPRRGSRVTMTGTKKTTVLQNGEMFWEYQNTVNGEAKLKMGDGTTTYENLAYALGDAATNQKVAFSANSRTSVAAALNDVSSGSTVATIVAALKKAISLNATAISNINDESTSGRLAYRVKTLESNTAKLHINPSSTQISNYSNGSIWIVTN